MELEELKTLLAARLDADEFVEILELTVADLIYDDIDDYLEENMIKLLEYIGYEPDDDDIE